jgi:hypothetical protein
MRIITEQEKQRRVLLHKEKEPIVLKKLKQFNPRLFPFIQEKPNLLSDPLHSCYLFGKPRARKTTQVMKQVLQWFEVRCIDHNWFFTDFEIITFSDLLCELKNTFTDNKSKEVIEKYRRAKLLVIDDMGSVEVKDWSYTLLYMIIDYRYSQMMTTFYTSNFTPDQLLTQSGDERLCRRIFDDCQIIECE